MRLWNFFGHTIHQFKTLFAAEIFSKYLLCCLKHVLCQARVRFPDSASYVGCVCCWFSSLLQEVFIRVLLIPIRSGIRGPQVCQSSACQASPPLNNVHGLIRIGQVFTVRFSERFGLLLEATLEERCNCKN